LTNFSSEADFNLSGPGSTAYSYFGGAVPISYLAVTGLSAFFPARAAPDG